MNRIELSINSKYSGNSLVDLDELLKKATKMKLEGIAITDFDDINSFFELDTIIKNYHDLDIIYGTKIKVIYKDMLIRVDILVKNKQGLNNLYKILTLVNKDDIDIDIYNLFDYSEGLLIGLNVINDNIYNLLNDLNNEDIYEFIKVFDYLIITPIEKHNYIKRIVEVTNYYHKLLVASSDVRYLNKEDKRYYEIFKGKKISSYNHLMSTKEMLDAFNYLNEMDRKKIVIDNPYEINLLIDKYIPLISEIKYFEDDSHKKILKDKIYKKANELYNNKIPKDIRLRIDSELSLINEINAYNLLINSKLVEISENMGYVTFTRGTIASSYINYLLGITKVNPLDYDLDYQEFYKDNILRLVINYDERVVKYLLDYLNKEFDRNNVVRCGVIGYISDSTIMDKIRNYEDENNIKFNDNDIVIIKNKLSNIKRTIGKLVRTYLCLPKYLDNSSYVPLINLGDLTTMVDYHKIQNNLLKITILHTSYNALYDDLMKIINIKNIDLNDSKVWNYIFLSNNVFQIFNDKKIIKAIEENKPTNIKQLATIWLDAHKTLYWTPSMAHAIEYALIYYKIIYIEYYYKDIFYKVARKYRIFLRH